MDFESAVKGVTGGVRVVEVYIGGWAVNVGRNRRRVGGGYFGRLGRR